MGAVHLVHIAAVHPAQAPYWLLYNRESFASAVPFKHRYSLERHFVRHGHEFHAASADEYERLAEAFMMEQLRAGALECRRTNGDLVRFDPRTNEFGVLSAAGHIATFMIVQPLPGDQQTPLQYFRSNCR